MKRLEGLDLARYLALVGMVLVNFDVVMVNYPLDQNSWSLANFLQGKAAALFVVLAGIGFGLSAEHKSWQHTARLTGKKFIFLLILGLLNSFVFQADIIHFYAFYFLFGVFILPLSNRTMYFTIVILMVSSVTMILIFDYDQGWDWTNYHYKDYWTGYGFFRNLLFNGWHPVIPWLAFLVIGLVLSRIELQKLSTQFKLLLLGGSTFIITTWLSKILISTLQETDQQLVLLLDTSPIPPMPLYMISAAGLAVAMVGCCLLAEHPLRKLRILGLVTPAGRQTLTAYMAHILVGMTLLVSFNKVSNQTPQQALIAAIVFCLTMTVLAAIWSFRFKHGPLEALMRKLTY